MHGATPHDLMASHGASLRALARGLVRDPQRAEDLVQDTFTAALSRPPTRGGDLWGWLATALHRRASNLRRGEALSSPLREALCLRDFEDRPPRRSAARLGVPVSTVKSRLERGLAELRFRLDADTGGQRQEWLGAELAWRMPRGPAGLVSAWGAGRGDASRERAGRIGARAGQPQSRCTHGDRR